MPRIRTIKPEFQKSESMSRISRDARLAFILLWPEADDSGRVRGHISYLSSALFPYDADARDKIGGWLDELEREGCIRRYKVGNDSYLEVVNFLKHQRIEKASPSRLPPFQEGSATIPGTVGDDSRQTSLDQGPRIKDQGRDQGVEAPQETCDAIPKVVDTISQELIPVEKSSTKRGTRWPADAIVPDDWIAEGRAARAKARLPAIDLETEATIFQNYWSERTDKGATKIGWRRTWINWCLKSRGTPNGNGSHAGKPGSGLTGFAAALVAAETRHRESKP